MSGIAGIAAKGKQFLVENMLNKISYRGTEKRTVFDTDNVSLGVVSSSNKPSDFSTSGNVGVQDYTGDGHFARAKIVDGKLVLTRDPLGVAPLYCGFLNSGELCFASEIKSLLDITNELYEVPPGCQCDGTTTERLYQLNNRKPLTDSPKEIARELFSRLDGVTRERIAGVSVGVWLSGDIDSGAIAVLARRHAGVLHTFSAGLQGSPELEYTRMIARNLQSDHHEIIVKHEDVLPLLPEVIYHLESFDIQVVRSGIINYLIAKVATDYVQIFLSDGGGNELFAGYEYLKSLPHEALSDELIDITRRLHNTTLQRIDRCNAAFGMETHGVFLHPLIFDYAFRIPVEYKLKDGVMQWILRRAMESLLPENMLKKQQFNGGKENGIGEQMNRHAENTIPTSEFLRERILPNGWILRNKEELMYYRIFKGQFGVFLKLAWMGRTKRPSNVGE